MIKSVNAIFLAAVYLLILAHSVIPHHHHAEHLPNEVSQLFINDKVENDHLVEGHSHHDHHHHSHDGHQHHDHDKHDSKEHHHDGHESESHSHDFPWHSHNFTAEDTDYTRTNIINFNLKPEVKDCFVCFIDPEYKIDIQEGFTYSITDPPFIIQDQFDPAASALRGPPAIA